MDSLGAVIRAFSAHGVTRAYFKLLSPNDNTKNQIYVGGSYGALQMLPFGEVTPDASTRGGSKGRPRFKCAMNFAWLLANGALSPAPEAKLILYPDYPEVRLSALLRGAHSAPSGLLASRAPGRALVLGVTPEGLVLGFMCAADHAVARELASLPNPDNALLAALTITSTQADAKGQLLESLRLIHKKEWIDSKRLDRTGAIVPCDAENCGGYTLEAELGVRPNGNAAPDFLGWEVKQFGVVSFSRPTGVLTLMTPEPDGGFYATKGVDAFIRKFGYADRPGRPDRLNFGGTHYVGKRALRTGLTLRLPGYDDENRRIIDLNEGVSLMADDGVVAARWRYAKLMEHWQRKHERAVYAMSQLKREPRRQYRYGPRVFLGTGADFTTLLHSFASGAIYYDPGIKLEQASTSAPRSKKRSQFRIKFAGLNRLYGRFDEQALL